MDIPKMTVEDWKTADRLAANDKEINRYFLSMKPIDTFNLMVAEEYIKLRTENELAIKNDPKASFYRNLMGRY